VPLRTLTFLAFFLGSTAATFVYPMAGVVCYLVLYHVYPQTTWWGKSIAGFGSRYALICGACLLVGTFLNLNRLKFGRRFLLPVEWGLLLVFLAILLSTATGMGWDARTVEFLDKMAKVFLFALLMTHVATTPRALWQIVVTLVVMALYLGHEAHVAPKGAFTDNRLNGIGGPDFQDSNGLSIHLCALIPFLVVLFRQQAWGWKVLAFLAAGYTANAILLCRTRSVAIAGAIAALLSIVYIPRRHRRWAAMALCLALAGVTYLSDDWYWKRVSTLFTSSEERDESVSTRLIIWSGAWEMIKDHPLGVGVGHFQRQIGRYTGEQGIVKRDAHNSYLLCAAEIGLPGLAAYLATLGLAWATLNRAARRLRASLADADRLELIIFANRIGLIVYMVAGFFSSRFYTEGQWILIAMTACIARTVENELRALEPRVIVLDQPRLVLPGLRQEALA
jgi:O-antigen ligase